MIRVITQIIVALMLLFAAVTLFRKSYLEFKTKRPAKGILYSFLGLLALFFAGMAFYYAYLVMIMLIAM